MHTHSNESTEGGMKNENWKSSQNALFDAMREKREILQYLINNITAVQQHKQQQLQQWYALRTTNKYRDYHL